MKESSWSDVGVDMVRSTLTVTLPHSPSSEAQEGAKVAAWISIGLHGQGGKFLIIVFSEKAIIILRQTVVSGRIFPRMKSHMQIERSFHACSISLREKHFVHPASFWKIEKVKGRFDEALGDQLHASRTCAVAHRSTQEGTADAMK